MNLIELVGDFLKKKRFWVGAPLWHNNCFDCCGKNHIFVYRSWFKRVRAMLFGGDVTVALLLLGPQVGVVELRIYNNYVDLYWDLANECFDDCELDPCVEFDVADPKSLEDLAVGLGKIL